MEFRAFLSDSKDVLDEATTMTLLERFILFSYVMYSFCYTTPHYSFVFIILFCSYGRVDELVYFASLKEQHEIVVHHYIQVVNSFSTLLSN